MAGCQPVDRAGQVVDLVEGELQVVLAALAQAHHGQLVVWAADGLGDRHRARRRARASPPPKKSAKPNGLLSAGLASPGRWRRRCGRRRLSPAPAQRRRHRALRLLVEQQHQAGVEVGLQRLLRQPAGPGEAGPTLALRRPSCASRDRRRRVRAVDRRRLEQQVLVGAALPAAVPVVVEQGRAGAERHLRMGDGGERARQQQCRWACPVRSPGRSRALPSSRGRSARREFETGSK